MRIELINHDELQYDQHMNLSHLLHLTDPKDTQLQASMLENGRLVGLAAYQTILGARQPD